MVDVFPVVKRSKIMSNIRSQGNKTTELRFIKLLRRYGITGWRRGRKLPGKPDIVFSRQRIAVFLDGDFWHGNPKKYRPPKSNTDYWRKKICANRRRDREVGLILNEMGWKVVRIWESSLRDKEAVLAKIKILV